ncbi:MAG: histidinol-phosphate transaminase [Deltaproteobacteria bacterium]|nr:histidinol-phosphate transaminase [Deltaproteobacteria bacterium]
MRDLVEPHLQNLIPYIPGKPIEETEREYGVTNIAKLASNENPMGPSPLALEAMVKAARSAHLYPDAGGFFLKERILQRHEEHKVRPEQLVLGNGTNEILTLLVRAFVGDGEAVLLGWPSFVVYRLAAKSQNRAEVAVPLKDDLTYDFPAMAAQFAERPEIKLVFLANPNNPTGQGFSDEELQGFLKVVPEDVVVVLDEAYAEYVDRADYPDGVALAMSRPRTVVTRTFSKAFGLAACRVGYAICDPQIADILNRLRDPFNTNTIGQAAALAALGDVKHVARSKTHNLAERPRLALGLSDRGFKVVPSDANFVLARVQNGMPDIPALHEELLKRAVIVRPVIGYGLADAARITVGTVEENDRLLEALDAILDRT